MKRAILVIVSIFILCPATAMAVKGPEFEWNGEAFNTYTSPSGFQWRINGEGNLELYHPEGGLYAEDTIIKKWTPQGWEDSKSQLEVEAECMGRAGNCVKNIESGETRLPRGTPPDEIEAGAEVITRERETAPYTEPEVTNSLDALGEWGGTIDAGAIASAATVVGGGLLLGPTAFKIGVDIGNGLDQLFGLPEWNWGQEESEDRTAFHNERVKIHLSFTVSRENKRGNTPYPVTGYYLAGGCDGELFCGGPEVGPKLAELGLHASECFYYNSGELPQNSINCGEGSGLETVLVCPAAYDGANCTAPQRAYEETGEPKLGGIPVPNTEEQENENSQHEYEPTPNDYAGRQKVPRLPVAPTATTNAPKLPGPGHKREPVLPQGRAAEQIQSPATVEALTPSSKKEEETIKKHAEEEKKLIPEAYPGETAKQYQKRLEGLGFTNVTVVTLGEVNENPAVGPDGVAQIAPSPGNKVSAETKIQISENPANAPEPGGGVTGETGGGIGPPTLPGFKFPNFGVVCEGFPFGVPCWLAETIKGWSATGKAPEWGLEEFEVRGKKIKSAKIELSHLEPVMEKVRPAMLIFATIGLVLLFYKFAKGGSPDSGGQGDSSSDNSSESEGGI